MQIGLLVAGLAAVVGASTFFFVRDALLDELDRSAREQFTTNAIVLAAALRTPDVDEVQLLTSLRPDVRARELLFVDEQWFTASLQVQPSDLPDALVDMVRSGEAASQRFEVRGDLVLGLGAPLGDGDLYFEVFSVGAVQSTLSTLRTTLVGVGSIATLAAISLGGWIGRAVARPLEEVSLAAAGIAAGDLTTRLEERGEEELVRIASSFNRMADSLQARIARESRFAADVSHELRSPLTTLVNAVSVLERRRGELSEDGREALSLLAGDVRRFERMVEDLIEISKHDAGSVRVELEDEPIGSALERALRRLRREGVPVTADPPAAAEVVVGIDRQRLEQVLANLVRNAEAYADGVTRIRLTERPGVVLIGVEDDGPGIGAAERERIFERFARGETGRKHTTPDGSGLGLALVEENVRAMRGTVWVEDAGPAGGARFMIELPEAGA